MQPDQITERCGLPGRRAAIVTESLLLSTAWLPASVALAGNLQLNFAGRAGTAWLIYIGITATAAALTLPWAVLQGLRRAWRRRGQA